MPSGPAPHEGNRPSRTHRRSLRSCARKLRPVVTVFQIVYYAVRLVRELMT